MDTSVSLFEYIILDKSTSDTINQTVESLLLQISEQNASFIKHHSSNIKDLIIYLTLKNRYPNTADYAEVNENESELNHPIILFINLDTYQTNDSTELNSLSFEDLKSLISDFFHHLNVIIQPYSQLEPITIPKQTIAVTAKLLKHRMTRVLSWIGHDCSSTDSKYSAVNSMVDDLSSALICKERNFTEMLLREIEYYELLKLNHPKSFYIDMIYEWGFKSHLLTYDELLYCSSCILEIAATNCEPNNIGDSNRILGFCFNVRDNYRMGNQFHNFRHAVDVLQATFYLLVRLDCLPDKETQDDVDKKKFLSKNLLPPPITLTLLIASFGHDIGHPGLTNKFLVDNTTPIAKYFNDISVLESFHYAEFRSILDKFFPQFFTDINGSEEIVKKSILSTDMINHFAYIDKIDDFMKFQQDVEDESLNTDEHFIEIRYLLCSLIIKCADISNVSRPLEVSAKWGVSLTNEINEIQCLEKNIQKPNGDFTTNFKHTITNLQKITVKEVVEKLPSISKGQCFFINNFVIMFFEKIQIILPALNFLYNQIKENVEFWESCQ